MAKQRYALKEDEILVKVQSAARNCINWAESKLSKERERVQDLYEQRSPKRQSEGNSSYVSSDVYDSVESMKAQLLETFGGGHEIVQFKPCGEQDVEPAKIETQAIEEIIFDDNNGFEIFHDIFDDSLKARNAVASVYWEDQSYEEEHRFDGMLRGDVEALAAQEEVTSIDAEMQPGTEYMGGVYSGVFCREVKKGRLCIEPVPPEEFYIEERARRREDATRGRRTLKTKAELIAMGLDEDKVAKISWDDRSALDTQEALARDETITSSAFVANGDPVQDELQQVLLHVTYIKLALKKGVKTAQLYRVMHAANVMFDCEPVEEDEFIDFRALRRAHSWWGNNFADRIRHTQNARTVLTRGILDHTAITINPRWQVVQGGLLNPKEMLDNRRGGLVNVTRQDALLPLQYGNLNPFVFQTLEMLKTNKEENTGISALSQGLNKDAISKQNSQGLVGDLVALSQVRQKVVARFFAGGFLVPLFLKIHRALRRHGMPIEIEYDGKWITTDPQQWRERSTLKTSLHLGYGEQEKEAVKYVSLYQQLKTSRTPFFGPEEEHALLTDAIKKNGFVRRYVMPLEKFQPPGPDPIEKMKAEAAMKNADAAVLSAQATMKKVTDALTVAQHKAQNDDIKTMTSAEVASRDADRKDLDVASRIDIAQRELHMLETAPPEAQRAIASPNA